MPDAGRLLPPSNSHNAASLAPSFAALDGSLKHGAETLGLMLSAAQRRLMLSYLALLVRWNRAYNLTAVAQPERMVARHLLDSLSLLPWLDGVRVLDVGSGAGLPGIPLAIAEPQRVFTLIDSNGKKVRFLRQVVRTLGLDQVEPVQARLPECVAGPRPDTVVARALAPLDRLVDWLDPWLEQGSRLLALKGPRAETERAELSDAYNVELVDLEVPGETACRRLVIVNRT